MITVRAFLFLLGPALLASGAFAAVAARLAPKGAFVIEAFVPETPARSGDRVEIRSMTATEQNHMINALGFELGKVDRELVPPAEQLNS